MKQTRKKWALTTKLSLAIVATGLLPALIIGGLALRTANQTAGDVGKTLEASAVNLADTIERNLFERYGDVQAFTLNEAVFDRSSWYHIGSESNRISAVANRYANLYGCYPLSYVVDLEGRLVAVNDKDPTGKAIDTVSLYQKNFKEEAWFQAAVAGQFTKSGSLDGTYLEDLRVDVDLKKVYGGEGLSLGFTALIKDSSGKSVGVWRNVAIECLGAV